MSQRGRGFNPHTRWFMPAEAMCFVGNIKQPKRFLGSPPEWPSFVQLLNLLFFLQAFQQNLAAAADAASPHAGHRPRKIANPRFCSKGPVEKIIIHCDRKLFPKSTDFFEKPPVHKGALVGNGEFEMVPPRDFYRSIEERGGTGRSRTTGNCRCHSAHSESICGPGLDTRVNQCVVRLKDEQIPTGCKGDPLVNGIGDAPVRLRDPAQRIQAFIAL